MKPLITGLAASPRFAAWPVGLFMAGLVGWVLFLIERA
jgi:hypothetical protein